jgi:hypothetical protein
MKRTWAQGFPGDARLLKKTCPVMAIAGSEIQQHIDLDGTVPV